MTFNPLRGERSRLDQLRFAVDELHYGGEEIEVFIVRPIRDGSHPSMVLPHHAPGRDEASIEMAR